MIKGENDDIPVDDDREETKIKKRKIIKGENDEIPVDDDREEI
jgi:hypothetical protein